jgi:hypothetical protein
MTFGQKIGRILSVTFALLVVCVLAAFTIASLLFLRGQGWFDSDTLSHFRTDAGIILAGFLVNLICVRVLLEIRKADLKPGVG